MKPRILLVDDEQATRFGFFHYLSRVGYDIHGVSSLAEAQEALSTHRWDGVILDLILPDGHGLDWIPQVREIYPDLPLIVITGRGDIPLAVEAMQRGADHFLTKPVNLAELDIFLRKNLELGNLRRYRSTQQRLQKEERCYFGESAAIQRVKELATLAAQNDAPVLLLGETGTGKGVLARWIHAQSPRHAAPFVEVNCAALKGDLLASELFGHVRGAFTGAVQERQGLIEVAEGGTLFLDEIGDMGEELQAQVLTVLEEKRYRRLGESRERRAEFRLLCATHRDLQQEVKQGRFRQDLYFRLHVFPISLPPLRERPEDLPGLVRHLLTTLGAPSSEVSPPVMALLQSYPWPGNIRELRNVLERALLLARGQPLTPDHFPGLPQPSPDTGSAGEYSDLDRLEARHIQQVLQRYGGDTREAARALGISRATLYRKLKKFRP
ncbi:MAG: sigma-54-dependent Fis family transcriptional regulator, partial [Nitrospinota bacterium]